MTASGNDRGRVNRIRSRARRLAALLGLAALHGSSSAQPAAAPASAQTPTTYAAQPPQASGGGYSRPGSATYGSAGKPDSKGQPDPRYPIDVEAEGRHEVDDFWPEHRDVFHAMDQVVTDVAFAGDVELSWKPGEPLPEGAVVKRRLRPLRFEAGNEGDSEAIYGRNTWMLWCAGNEDFWDWLAQEGYGVLDFLKVLDSRKRGSRLRDLGLVNQPGMRGTDRPGPFGLYLDVVEEPLGEDLVADDAYAAGRAPRYEHTGERLESDGVDPLVYGYPSGVIGLRLFPNPKFGSEAAQWWNAEAFYADPAYAKDPRTVRPLLVGMSCVVCHIGPHPLNAPADAEEPEWENLSCIIGNQYFKPSAAFGGRVERANFLWHFLAAQQPGTIDTSMVSSDQINNSNAMNAVFELPGRVARARLNPAEAQGSVAQTLPGEGRENRVIARVLMDGADSIGLAGALLRVFENIGMYHDEWNRCSNPVIGMVPQRPFSIDASRSNSLYWRVNESFRAGFLQKFFLWEKRDTSGGATNGKRIQCSTAAMHLGDALVPTSDGAGRVPLAESADPKYLRHWDRERGARGVKVFTEHCIVCHSSKQPDGFRVEFAHAPPGGAKWDELPVRAEGLTLPFAFADWDAFKRSPAYRDYTARAGRITGNGEPAKMDEFLADNYLSTDLRIPVSLVGTNSARAVGTNAMEGQVWAEYASETYKTLPAVGPIHCYDPFSKRETTYAPPGGGPGYYRVPSLVSVWATAPLLHNNALGLYVPDDDVTHRVSVAGRLEMFDDAIGKLLWKEKRGRTPSGLNGLREAAPTAWRGADPGWIFRTDVETELRIPRGHIRRLITGALPGFVPPWLASQALAILDHPARLPLVLALLGAALALWWPRGFFYLTTLVGVALVALLALSGIHYLLPWEIWLAPLVLIASGLGWIVSRAARDTPAAVQPERASAREKLQQRVQLFVSWSGVTAYALFLLGLLGALWTGREFVDGRLTDLIVGPFPKGTPVNAIMNLDPTAPTGELLAAVRGLMATLGELRAADAAGRELSPAERLAVFDRNAGPALMRVSKCPDLVLDRGHEFGEALSDDEKQDLIAFLKLL
jgi:hypothetical protein